MLLAFMFRKSVVNSEADPEHGLDFGAFELEPAHLQHGCENSRYGRNKNWRSRCCHAVAHKARSERERSVGEVFRAFEGGEKEDDRENVEEEFHNSCDEISGLQIEKAQETERLNFVRVRRITDSLGIRVLRHRFEDFNLMQHESSIGFFPLPQRTDRRRIFFSGGNISERIDGSYLQTR